jgi:tetratricopeptide (TPR) repeat protein
MRGDTVKIKKGDRLNPKLRTVQFWILIICLVFCHSSVLAKVYISEKSDHLKYGVRMYSGSLPENIEYKSLGRVSLTQELSGMSLSQIGQHNTALEMLLYKARKLGANAITDIKTGLQNQGVYSAEAVVIKEFPDSYTEEDFKKFKGPKEYENSTVLNYPYKLVFDSAKKILKDELYNLSTADEASGVIETEPIEVPNKSAFPNVGPYPVLKIRVSVVSLGGKSTEITEKYVFIKGRPRSKSFLKKGNKRFFFDIEKDIKKLIASYGLTFASKEDVTADMTEDEKEFVNLDPFKKRPLEERQKYFDKYNELILKNVQEGNLGHLITLSFQGLFMFPDERIINAHIGSCYIEGGNFDGAIKGLKQGIKKKDILNKSNSLPSIYNTLAVAYINKGDRKNTKKYIFKAYDIDNKNPATLYTMARCYFDWEDYENALKYYEEAFAVNKNLATDEDTVKYAVCKEKTASQ